MPVLHGKLRIDETMAYSKEMEALSDALHAELGFGDQTDARFHEYVAREHLDTGMPVVELHRNHGIPLSAVKRWIATFAAEGRAGLEAAAATARAKAIGRDAKLARAKIPPAELDALRHVLSSTDFRVRREAYPSSEKRSSSFSRTRSPRSSRGPGAPATATLRFKTSSCCSSTSEREISFTRSSRPATDASSAGGAASPVS